MTLTHFRMLAATLAIALGLSAWPVRAEQRLVWFDASGPTALVREAVDLLRDAQTYGLDPTDYQGQVLFDTAQRTAASGDWHEPLRAQFDAALTDAMQRFLSDLQTGRIKPAQLGAVFALTRRPQRDPAQLLREALDSGRLSATVQDITQQVPAALPLQAALQHYRILARTPGWTTPLPMPTRGKLEIGDTYPALAELEQRLVAVGDLPARTPVPEQVDTTLIAAVRQFQLRHGLEPDGVVGRLTLAQLNVTPSQRVRQIALTMERLRWTPLLQAQRMIVVNVPEFMLRAYTVQANRVDIALEMKIIVGKALDTRTPLFDEDMRFIEFSPYWNVPRSIATQELLPQLRTDPAHFYEQGYEFVTADRSVVRSLSEEHLQAVEQGGWRIRQRPGPKNALGAIKFIFPNNGNIYLHHTPAPRLFARQRRDFSHGCVRVEAPVALARFVLQDDPHWNHERIEEAMSSGSSRTIRLRDPLPVLIDYRTVVVKHGQVFFYDDLYGHDRVLDDALRARSAALARALPRAPGL